MNVTVLSSVIKISEARWSCRRLFPDPPLPFPNEPRDAGRTAGGSQWTISGEGCPAWAGPCIRALSVCLLNHSSPGAGAAPLLPPLGRRTQLLARRPLGCNSAQPTASGENTGRERQEDIPAQHKGPASAAGRAGGTFLCSTTKGITSTSCFGQPVVEPFTSLSLSFSVRQGWFQDLTQPH